jgi:hypothetical protein
MSLKGLSRLAAAVCGLVLAGSVPVSAAPGNVIQTFEVREHYGVNHPEQVIDFDLKDKATVGEVYVVGSDGEPVLFQLLDGGAKVAVLTDLPAGATRTWKLMSGSPPKTFPALVRVTETTINELPALAVTNNLTGVKVLGTFRPASIDPRQWVAPFGADFRGPEGWLYLPAPIQDVRMRDGTWAGPGRSSLGVEAKRLVKQAIRVLERGPLRVAVEVTYELQHDDYRNGDKVVAPAGIGYYRFTARLEAGRSALLFEDETNLNLHWYLDLYAAVRPDQFRYRGHSATKPEFGQEEDGAVYHAWYNGADYDAILPLKYDRARWPNYSTNEDSFLTVSPWNPWSYNGGRYWQMLNTKADAKANVVGIFAARAGRAVGVSSNGPGFWLKPPTKALSANTPATNAQAGIGVTYARRMPDATILPKTRLAWGLFVGTKKDVKPVKELQSINREMNLLGGFNLNKVHRYTLDFEPPPSGYGGLMMDKAAVDAIRQRVKSDKEYHDYLYQADSQSRLLFDLWAESGREHFDKQVEASLKLAHDLLETLVNGNGILDYRWHYWMGGNQMVRQTVLLDQLLGDPRCTPEQTAKLKAAAVLFGSVLWDDDFVPMQAGASVNYGPANMPVMMTMARNFYALLLATHPAFRERAKVVLEQASQDLHEILDANGVPQQCPNYIEAAVTPVVNLLAMCKQRGRDPFQGEPRIGKFADFYLNLLTPPEPRFTNKARSLVTLGDTGLDQSVLYGLVGTALRDADPKASARLMGAWRQSKKRHSFFFGASVVMIDETLKGEDPNLGDYDAPNYYSVLRHGWGTPDESALWFITGDRYNDHRHADQGSIVLYALGKPVVQDWSSMYTPRVSGTYMHNGCTLEKSLPFPWDRDGAAALDIGTSWDKSTPVAFRSFAEGAMSQARFEANVDPAGAAGAAPKKPRIVTWTRTVVALRPKPAQPVYVLRDEFDPASSDLKKILTLNVMADGPVQTPAGEQKPEDRLHPRQPSSKDPKNLPFAGRPMTLSRGANRFAFAGRYGVDCEVFVLADGADALVGRWAAHVQSSYIPEGSPAGQERQDILRVRAFGPVTTVIVPQRQNEKRRGVKVEADGDGVVIRSGDDVYRVTADGYTIETGGARKVSRTWSDR